MRMNDRLVWIDCEMTGLDIERDALIEIACLVTDAQLNQLDASIACELAAPDRANGSPVRLGTRAHELRAAAV